MRKWVLRSAELKAAGVDGKEHSPAHAKEILQSKNLKFFAELVLESWSPDIDIAEDSATGFALMDKIPTGGIFPFKPAHATLTPDQVWDMAGLARTATWNFVRKEKQDGMCREIFESTINRRML